MFKQFLKAKAMQYCQIDACRLGGVNEVLAVILLAAKYKGLFLSAAKFQSPVMLLFVKPMTLIRNHMYLYIPTMATSIISCF